MASSKDIRLRLCDPNKKRLPLIKDHLRKKVINPWFGLSEKELSRIRRPFESYEKELLEDGYPESSQHLQRLLAVKNEMGERETALIKDKSLLHRTMTCFRHMESCQRDKCSTTEAVDNLLRLAHEISKSSDRIACVFYEIMLDKMRVIDCAESSKCELQYSFGKFLVKIKDYEKANKILKEALERSEENNFGELTKRICKEYYGSLYNLCLNVKTFAEDVAIQLADDSKDIALKVNDFAAVAKSILLRGSILMSMQRYDEAIIDFKSATSELKKIPDLNLKVEILYKLSTCYFTIKDYDSCLLSLGALGRLAAIYNKIEYQAHFGRIDGNVKLLMGEYLTARKNFIKSIDIYDNIGLRDYATSCRFLEAVAKCEHLFDPWITLLIDGEKEQPFEDRYEFNKSKILVFNWKLKREYFSDMTD